MEYVCVPCAGCSKLDLSKPGIPAGFSESAGDRGGRIPMIHPRQPPMWTHREVPTVWAPATSAYQLSGSPRSARPLVKKMLRKRPGRIASLHDPIHPRLTCCATANTVEETPRHQPGEPAPRLPVMKGRREIDGWDDAVAVGLWAYMENIQRSNKTTPRVTSANRDRTVATDQ